MSQRQKQSQLDYQLGQDQKGLTRRWRINSILLGLAESLLHFYGMENASKTACAARKRDQEVITAGEGTKTEGEGMEGLRPTDCFQPLCYWFAWNEPLLQHCQGELSSGFSGTHTHTDWTLTVLLGLKVKAFPLCTIPSPLDSGASFQSPTPNATTPETILLGLLA